LRGEGGFWKNGNGNGERLLAGKKETTKKSGKEDSEGGGKNVELKTPGQGVGGGNPSNSHKKNPLSLGWETSGRECQKGKKRLRLLKLKTVDSPRKNTA